MEQTDLFRNKTCIGPTDTESHNLVMQAVKQQQTQIPKTEEDGLEESIIEFVMFCTKCGLITSETIDFGK